MEIKDAVAVVTGGASGLGLATTKRLLDKGASVVVIDLKGEEVVDELGPRARFAKANVTDPESVSARAGHRRGDGPAAHQRQLRGHRQRGRRPSARTARSRWTGSTPSSRST